MNKSKKEDYGEKFTIPQEKIHPVDTRNDRMMVTENLRLPRRNVDFSWKVKSPQEKKLVKLYKKLYKIKSKNVINVKQIKN